MFSGSIVVVQCCSVSVIVQCCSVSVVQSVLFSQCCSVSVVVVVIIIALIIFIFSCFISFHFHVSSRFVVLFVVFNSYFFHVFWVEVPPFIRLLQVLPKKECYGRCCNNVCCFLRPVAFLILVVNFLTV